MKPVEPGREETATRVETTPHPVATPDHKTPGTLAMVSVRPDSGEGWVPRVVSPSATKRTPRRGGVDSHLVARAGVEPATFHFSGERYYQLSYLAGGWPVAHPATPTGLEPATSAVTGRRANQLRHGANFLTCWLSPARVTLAALPGFGKSGFGAA